MGESIPREPMAQRRGLQEANHLPPVAPSPTKAIPGTEWKIVVMEWRVEQGYQPHHPDDYMEEKKPE
jgi:hypothetical protein